MGKENAVLNATWSFIGGFAAVSAGITLVVLLIRRRLRRFSSRYLGGLSLSSVLSSVAAAQELEPEPRSVNGCDRFVIPRIVEDFPDFDATLAKTRVREYLQAQLRDRKKLRIHKIVFRDYLPAASQKTVVFQAAVEWKEEGKTVQSRYRLHYCYSIATGDKAVAANCPNCGGNLGYGDTVCPYCGSRVVNVMENTWEFTEMLPD